MPDISLKFGSQNVALQIPDGKLVQARADRKLSHLGNVKEAVTDSLESPIEFPALRRALTPDDHIAIVVRQESNQLAVVVEAVIRHVLSAGVKVEQITVLVAPQSLDSKHDWMNQLPGDCQGFQLEEHHEEQSKLAYLASTKGGRRIYLNRVLVDADQIIVIGNARFDPVFGIASGLAELFPAFSDTATRLELTRHLHESVPAVQHHYPVWKEIDEVGWELGMPFVLCVLEGEGESVCGILAGSAGPVQQQAEMWLRSHRLLHLPEQVDLVIGTLTGNTSQQSFLQLGHAAFRASLGVHQGGNIAIISEAGPVLPAGSEMVSAAESVVAGLTYVRKERNIDSLPWWYLAHAMEHAKVYAYSRYQQEVMESLFIAPLDSAAQAQNLIQQARSVLVVEGLDRACLQIGSRSVGR